MSLIWEDPCEHGFVRPHCDIHAWCIELEYEPDEVHPCVGGSRDEVTPNYQIGWDAFDRLCDDKGYANPWDRPPNDYQGQFRSIIDAALGNLTKLKRPWRHRQTEWCRGDHVHE